MKKILITGSSGMLGKDIYSIFAKSNNFSVYGLDKIADKRIPNENQFIGDLTDDEFLTGVLKTCKPNIIIHCAAIVNLQTCETDKELANSVHVESTRVMANFNSIKSKLIYVSTDSVFDGEKGNYLETDETCPLNYYAKSKILGEDAAKINPNHLVIRTNIFGYNIPLKKSIVEWAIENFNQENKVSGFTDIIFNAIYTKHFAKILFKLVENDIIGTINLASSNIMSKYSFLKYFKCIYSGNSELIESSLSEKIKFDIQRPKNTTLNISKLKNITDVTTIEEGINELVKDYLEEIKYENH
ncbi:MAG: SDR family oxidoreductase [Melioribacteraceae bacterium]|jgi:dTDP-4-dehydrorhamnose reductase|nr:SDR family oxidoreductase [Melioribacteraceae bacterium]